MFYSTGDKTSSFTDTCPLAVKVGCSVTRRYWLRLMTVLIYQDFSNSESQKCTSGSMGMSV
ncbi:hypothetical protein QUB05_03150 [Microcoleus sp. F10-C6]|uniref:hypothetical protein n=1 Tax=unclassified Microcoleus TaxID=2642155 RepID=UPI002FD6F758